MGKKGRKEYMPADEDYELPEPATEEVEQQNVTAQAVRKKKGKKKLSDAAADDASVEPSELGSEQQDVEDEQQDLLSLLPKKKKGKKKSAEDSTLEFSELATKEFELHEEVEQQEVLSLPPKKKKGKKQLDHTSFQLLNDEHQSVPEDEAEQQNSPKEELEDQDILTLSPKEKKGKKKQLDHTSFQLLDDEHQSVPEDEAEQQNSPKEELEDQDILTLPPRKKKGKKKQTQSTEDLELPQPATKEEEPQNLLKEAEEVIISKEEAEQPNISKEERSQSSKKKKGKNKQAVADELPEIEQQNLPKEEVEQQNIPKEELEEQDILSLPPKKKKGKKKQTQSIEGPTPLELHEPTTKEDEPQNVPKELGQLTIPKEEVEQPIISKEEPSQASKKKKGKKKPSADDAATDGATKNEEVKGKAGAKPVSKAVRQLQERLAKQKELEEQKKREEEERIRKEEEERARLEQEEREREELKRLRKEREKQKREEKKKAGLILTKKGKEEARRLAIMREQFIKDGGIDQAAAPKKPKYEVKKKRKPQGTANGTGSADDPTVEKDTSESQVDVVGVLDEVGGNDVEQEQDEADEYKDQEEDEDQEEEEDDDWEAKSWDNEDVPLPPVQSSFTGEEEEEAEEPVRPAVVKNISPKASFKSLSDETTPETAKVTGDSGRESQRVVDKDDDQKLSATADDLRSPICCILGHVDTGKTKLLDCIRRTKVQEGEAGGITQQIGATYFPRENIREKTQQLKADANLRVPGLLVIDTPGHESFTNLRSRGSGLCDIAVLVIDIMHGLEPQTIESLDLLKMRKTPYVIALNKVDRLYGWKVRPNAPINVSLKDQPKETKQEFETRVTQIITQLKEQGLNSELYWKNKELVKRLKTKTQNSDVNWTEDEYANIVPTSAITGEGIPDLLLLLVQLTQKMLETRLTYKTELECTVLEVKVVEGLGTTIDVVLVNGVLHEGDQIVVCGMQGPIVTSIRALLTPHPMKELRVKGSYQHHKELKAAQGIKITAQGLEHAIAGTQLYVVGSEDDLEEIKSEAMQDVNNVLSRIDKSGEGVCVQASTLGSLEALLEFLKSPAVKIPVSGINIGPVHKKDVMRASVMLEKKREFAAILAFDVKVNPEARELAEELGVRIFTADIIYHLFDQFTAYMESVKSAKRSLTEGDAVFPCILKILPNCVFNSKDPIVVGVEVLEGVAKVGTPLCVPKKGFIDLGRVASLEVNHKIVDAAKKGEQVAVKIVGNAEESQKSFGRHFDLDDELVSHVTRKSIDVLKENFRDEVSKDEWRLMAKLKILFQIQ